MKKYYASIILLFTVILSACGGKETTVPATETLVPATLTPDPCSEANLPDEITKVHKFMREFDDYSALASNTPQQQLIVVIPELQRILRDAQDQTVPSCLGNLKELQLGHMSMVVQTLLAFVGNSDAKLVNEGIARARDLHVQYDVEMARLLGITLTASTPVPTGTP